MGNFQLGTWLVQPAAGLLTERGKERRIEPKVMAVLEVLAEANGDVVTRETIMDKVWPNQEITDDVLNTCISSLRRSLGDDRRNSRYVQTLPKHGYRLLVAVEPAPHPDTVYAPVDSTPPVAGSSLYQKKRWVGLLLVIILAVGFILWPGVARHPADLPDFRSIAVLPFDVFSDRPDVRHFADGLAEELVHQLTNDPALRVIARTSSFKFRDHSHSIAEIATILNVRHVLEGSVRDSEAGMRITIQLIDTSNDFHLWSKVFDVGRGNVFEVQEQVGLAVSKLIPTDVNVAGPNTAPPFPISDEASRLYLMGQSYMRVATVDAYAKAAVFFADAIRIAPDYALAYSRLAAAQLLLYEYRHDPLDLATQRARTALDKALELDPQQAEAYAVLGLLHTYRKEYAAAETAFLRAIELRPNLHFARHNYAFMLWSQSRFKDALVQARIALDSDPLSGITNFLVADSLAGLGDFDSAKQVYERCQEKLPEYYGCYTGAATIAQLFGDYEAASELLEQAGSLVKAGNFWQDSLMGALAIRQGKYTLAAELLTRVSKKSPLDYNLLKSRLLMSLHTGEVVSFAEELAGLRELHPNDHDLNLISALTSFYTNDCAEAVALYSRELEHSQAFLFDYWDLDDGFSHATSLAFCYGEMGLVKDRARLMKGIGQQLGKIKALDFPGSLYLQARFHRLAGRNSPSVQLLARLAKEHWPLRWLADADPVFAKTEPQ